MEMNQNLSSESTNESIPSTSLQVIKAPERARFYDPEKGIPVVEVIGSTTGKPRNPTIKDAKKYKWLPSVTTIIRIVASHELNAWKEDNLLKTAVRAVKSDGETEEDFIRRIAAEADLIGDLAAERGTIIHAGLSMYFKQGTVSEDPCIKKACEEICEGIKALEKIQGCKCALQVDMTFFNKEYQFAGSCDLWLAFENGYRVIIDFKSTKLDDKYKPYFSHKLQLGGYQLGLFPEADHVDKCIIAVDKVDGRVKWCWIEERNCVDLFKCANALWRSSNRF